MSFGNIGAMNTDWADDHPDPSSLPRCDYCKRRFDTEREGHEDEITGLSFCDAPCEMHYDEVLGLPNEYRKAI
jgi:hypothetical protein